MCKLENKICNLIRLADTNDSAVLNLSALFNPLLEKYAYKLSYEDAYNDLLLFFIELIKKLSRNPLRKQEDKYYLSYIKNSIKNKYIELLKHHQRTLNDIVPDIIEDDDGNQTDIIDNLNSVYDDYSMILLDDIKAILTNNEYEIIKMIFYQNYSIKEISEIKGISRQCINQYKLRALKKLKDNLL